MDYARSLFKSLVAGQNVNLDDKQRNNVPQLKSADGGNYMTMSGHGHGGRADHDGTQSHSHQVLLNVPRGGHVGTEGKRTGAEVSMISEAALANAATNPPPGNYMTMSGHGHGGRADHDGTPSHSHQVLLNVPRGGHVGTGGKRTGAPVSMLQEAALANATSNPPTGNYMTKLFLLW